MKFAAVATFVLAGVAQAAVANQAMDQDLAANMAGAGDMDSMTLLTGLYGKGGHGGGKVDFAAIIKKATCALPCVERAASKVPCKGKNLVDSACSSINEIKRGSESCVTKCGVDKGIVDLVAKGAHFLCSKRPHGNGKPSKPSKPQPAKQY